MIEYRIEVPSDLKKVKYLWKKFLKKDDTWHFTLEGSYIELRVRKRIPVLDALLKKKKWNYTTFTYSDNIPITRKYQEQYEKIFHGFSELAMIVKREKGDIDDWESEVYRVIERCIHLVFNVHGLDQGKEAYYLGIYSIDRAIGAGRTRGFMEKGFDPHGNAYIFDNSENKEVKDSKRRKNGKKRNVR